MTPSEALASVLENHAEHFGMDETTILQESIETLALAEKMTRMAAVLPGDTIHILHAHQCAYRSALEELEALSPDDFKDHHLPVAMRAPDFQAAFRKVVQIVNKVLHNADEYGEPLAPGVPLGERTVDQLARAVVEACVACEEPEVNFIVTPAEMHEIQKLGARHGINVSGWEAKIAMAVRTSEEHMAVGRRHVNLVVAPTRLVDMPELMEMAKDQDS